ncbi:unnamed protein product [Adineta steineri]|uniref:Dynamin N-terminal domain-containing protein n=1 Tax=Adineta steineri TaxID=433720 RepID=A0A815WLD3_9BILA|nr:unnamed protein product [Adineta steineri]
MPWKSKSHQSDNASSSNGLNSKQDNVSNSSPLVETRSDTASHGSTTSQNSSSTTHPSAQQWSYQRGAQSATTAAKQIEDDMQEVRNIIANYSIEPLEILHLVDRWLQQLVDEFFEQRDHFKYILYESWQNQELPNIKYDNNDPIRQIYAANKELEKARDNVLSHKSFNDLNSYLAQTDEQAIDEMKEKFNSLIGQYDQVLQHLEVIDKQINTTTGGDNYISDIRSKLSTLKILNNKESHTICIVGLEKAGKSTFINALLGFELLPIASERCTQIRTVLKPTLGNNDQQLFATATFYDDQEFQVFFSKMTKKTDENEAQLTQRKEAVLQKRESLKAKFPAEHFRVQSSNNVERERNDIIKRLNEYITGELYVNIIKEVAIYTDKLPGKNYELLDVPGFDSPIKEHRDAGLQAIKSADAFLFLTSGQQPSLTEPQITLLQEIQQNHFEAMQRAFGIITKLDLCQTATICHEHYRKTCAELVDKRFKPERIFAACPRIQIIDENSEEYQVIDRKLNSFGDDLAEGFSRSKEALDKFIKYELPKTHLKQLIDLGRTRLVRLVMERLNRIKEKQLLPSNLANVSIDEYIKQQNTENWDHLYYEGIFQPVFDEANTWHATIVSKNRAEFIDDVHQKFRDSFLDLTKEFVQRKFPIEKLVLEKYNAAKLQLNVHPVDTEIRARLSIELEKLVNQTSDILAEYLYHKYVSEMENLLNNICLQSQDLYCTKLTLEKCIIETHALVLRICRPVIMATLRYSYIDLTVKQDAIHELLCIAPIVAFNIANRPKPDTDGDLLGSQIQACAEFLADKTTTSSWAIRTLFRK